MEQIIIDRTNGTVRVKSRIMNGTKITPDFHYGKVIGPNDDVSEEPEDIQLAAQAARLNYIPPEPTEEPV